MALTENGLRFGVDIAADREVQVVCLHVIRFSARAG